jgi:hypothetical protein
LNGNKLPSKLLTVPFRLKAHRINEELLAYIRNILSESKGIKLKMMSLPTDLQFEIEVALIVHLNIGVQYFKASNSRAGVVIY